MKRLLLIVLVSGLLAAAPAAVSANPLFDRCIYDDEVAHIRYCERYYHRLSVSQDTNGKRVYSYDLYNANGEVVSHNCLYACGKPQICDDLGIALEDFDEMEYVLADQETEEGKRTKTGPYRAVFEPKEGRKQIIEFALFYNEPLSFSYVVTEPTGDPDTDDCIAAFAGESYIDCAAYDKFLIGGTEETEEVLSEVLPENLPD